MSLKLYDTMSKKVVELVPIADEVTIYTCGPTVYDYPHIGNWYSFIRWDLLNRVLLANGYKTNWVMNITDVGHLVSDADDGEDKLEKGAKREGKTAWDVAKYYGDYFTNGLERLNFSKISLLPKATDHIEEQIQLVQKLENKGHTYVIDDGVYFDTSTCIDYGKLAHLDITQLKEGARVEANPQKRNPTDFALWKFSPKEEQRDMEWDSPWGKGFPGWHIECSAMSMKYLGETLDIHAGGIDHIPVHHTNEIAQSESATGKIFANIWLHSNFILVDGKKMSKSLGNFYTLEDIENKGYDLEVFRLAVLSSHYRSESQFSWSILDAFKERLATFRSAADLRWQASQEGLTSDLILSAIASIKDSISDDLNGSEMLKEINAILDQTLEQGIDPSAMDDYSHLLDVIDLITGLKLSQRQDISTELKEILAKRQSARVAKDWSKSDALRDELLQQGISVKDTASGQKWSRIN